jgi:hypothetical protein
MVRGSPIVDAPPVDRRSGASNAEVTAVGDAGQTHCSPEQTVIPRAPGQCIPSRAVLTDTPYQTHPQVRGRSWRLITPAPCLPGSTTPCRALNSPVPQLPSRATRFQMSCKDSAPSQEAPGSKTRLAAHCLIQSGARKTHKRQSPVT